MKRILIPEDKLDLALVRDMILQNYRCECGEAEKNTSLEAVVLVPGDEGGWAKWTVVDNRDHQAYVEDFATLDGAMVYATDIRTTCEHQDEWDADGMFRKFLDGMLGKRQGLTKHETADTARPRQ